MCTTNNNKKTKKKYTHPPLEDSRKLEDFTCLEYSERLIDYEGNIGYSNEGFPVDVVEIDFGNGERMFLPANNYEVNIKLQKYGDQITLTIRAVNLSTGECKTVTQSHICHDAQQSYPSQFLSTKGQRKNQFPMNNQRQFNPSHAHYKPVGNQSCSLQLSSYDEPKVMQSGGGPGWEPFVGTAGAVAGEMYYSEKYGTWMGKNFKMYKQTWGGNGTTGGKLKFGKKVSTGIKVGGYGLGIWNAYNIRQQNKSGQITDGQMYMEQGSNLITTMGGIYGAAWGIGWELGRAVTNTEWYQEAKFNFWYNYWERQVGAPSQSNEVFWNYFNQNYKP